MSAHLEQPAERGPVHGVEAPKRAGGDDFLHLLKVGAVFDLMAHHRPDARLPAQFHDFRGFLEGSGHRLFVGDQPAAGLDAQADHRKPHGRRRAKAEDVWLDLSQHLGRVEIFFRIARKLGRGVQSLAVPPREGDDIEAPVFVERLGVDFPALAGPVDGDGVFFHRRHGASVISSPGPPLSSSRPTP